MTRGRTRITNGNAAAHPAATARPGQCPAAIGAPAPSSSFSALPAPSAVQIGIIPGIARAIAGASPASTAAYSAAASPTSRIQPCRNAMLTPSGGQSRRTAALPP